MLKTPGCWGAASIADDVQFAAFVPPSVVPQYAIAAAAEVPVETRLPQSHALDAAMFVAAPRTTTGGPDAAFIATP